SSRRRHTRSKRDWSSDVCSSDLPSWNPSVVETLNLGFHEGQDNGRESLPASYRHPTQPVTSISNLQNLTGLKRFMAARTGGGERSEERRVGKGRGYEW